MINALEKLREKAKPKFTFLKEYMFAEEEAYIHCLLFRVLELSDGYVSAFNRKHHLTALCAIRSCIETIVVADEFKNQWKTILNSKPGKTLDKNLNELREKFIFGRGRKNKKLEEVACSRLPLKGIDAGQTIATNIQTYLEKRPDILNFYEDLCEFTHPNCLGVYSFYIQEDNNELINIQQSAFPLPMNLEGIESALCLFNDIHEDLLDINKRLHMNKAHFFDLPPTISNPME